MHPLIAVLLVTTVACADGRPPISTLSSRQQNDEPPTSISSNVMIEKMRPPRMEDVIPRYFALEERPRYMQSFRDEAYDENGDWLTREINRLSDDVNYEENQDRVNPLLKRSEEVPEMAPLIAPTDNYEDQIAQSVTQLTTPLPKTTTETDFEVPPKKKKVVRKRSGVKTSFALTPMDRGYYDKKEAIEKVKAKTKKVELVHKNPLVITDGQRRIRQNPNLGKSRNLVSDDMEEFKAIVENGGYPPTVIEGIRGEGVNSSSVMDPAQALYGVAMMAAVGTASVLGLLAFIFGWFTISRRSKAAEDFDYPGYGVTGPSLDSSGDRKLAQSAHIYHYQHQKQQILAMERSGADLSRSVSDLESEEENEEGDYTVYECPGFATTGDMVVKNPLYSEEPTPATPGKCELVKPQPKE